MCPYRNRTPSSSILPLELVDTLGSQLNKQALLITVARAINVSVVLLHVRIHV